jgi:hypothetical protein
MHTPIATSVRLLLLATACATPDLRAAEPAPSPPKVVALEWNVRLRDEYVDDALIPNEANALTLRLRAGLRFNLPHGFSALVEGEGIASAGEDYNSGANGHTDRPLIADAEGAELNQAWVSWKGERLQATAGRQRLLFDNQRWIGNSGWRQNEQTFDAVALEASLPANVGIGYAWLDKVHRVNGDQARDPLARERDLSTHLLHAGWKHGIHQLVGYAWLHEDQGVRAASTATWGVRSVSGRVDQGHGWNLALEVAQQRDYADNPLDFSHSYWLVEPALVRHGVSWRAGWEHLGGNGTHALQTPLATLHAFNGWADKFTTTPAGGLEDMYLAPAGKLCSGKCDWQLAWHEYRGDTGGRYGHEWNASLAFPVARKVKGLVKLADYHADEFAGDTQKAWVQLEWTN